MTKRLIDILISIFGLICTSPVILFLLILIWLQDKKTPLYIAPRVGKNGVMFNLVKLRSMRINSESLNINSTSEKDIRITSIGKKIRKYKLDEFTQFWNVLVGDMSLVGPRPNVQTETDLYTDIEKKLLSVKPGITDFSSIVFSDEGKILEYEKDPDLAYNQLIRPWKSRLGLIYIKHQSIFLDLQIIIFTFVALISKKKALHLVCNKLKELDIDEKIISVSKRKNKLYPYPPPGSNHIVNKR